jgi:hypothetical protein
MANLPLYLPKPKKLPKERKKEKEKKKRSTGKSWKKASNLISIFKTTGLIFFRPMYLPTSAPAKMKRNKQIIPKYNIYTNFILKETIKEAHISLK